MSELLDSPFELLDSPFELLDSPFELLVSPFEILVSPFEIGSFSIHYMQMRNEKVTILALSKGETRKSDDTRAIIGRENSHHRLERSCSGSLRRAAIKMQKV